MPEQTCTFSLPSQGIIFNACERSSFFLFHFRGQYRTEGEATAKEKNSMNFMRLTAADCRGHRVEYRLER